MRRENLFPLDAGTGSTNAVRGAARNPLMGKGLKKEITSSPNPKTTLPQSLQKVV